MNVWQLIAENRIQEAIDQGAFENLPGAGKPLDLSDYFTAPASERVGFSLLKSAGVVPVEIQMLKEAEELEARLRNCDDPAKADVLRAQFQAREAEFQLAMDRRRRAVRSNLSLDGGVT